jgi:hypothetical protein
MPTLPFSYVICSKHLRKELIELKFILPHCEELDLNIDLIRGLKNNY